MREALRSLISLSFFCGAALYFCPEGGARRILALLCAAVIASAALSPLHDFDYASLSLAEARLGSAEAQILQNSRDSSLRLRMLYLEDTAARFLEARAEELNTELLSVRLEVVETEDGGLTLYAVTIRAMGTEEHAEKLCLIIQEELGIPLERQAWTLNE